MYSLTHSLTLIRFYSFQFIRYAFSGGSLQAVVAARYPQGVPEVTAKSWFAQIVAGKITSHFGDYICT